MSNRKKIDYIAIILTAILFLNGVNSAQVTGKTDLEVEGNVLGYNLYLVKSTNMDGLMYPALVKVTKVVEGKEKSEYILVLFHGLIKDYAEENFGLEKHSVFKLERQTFCDIKIKDLVNYGLIVDNGKVVEKSQTFTFVPGVEKNSLPLKKLIPCYFVSFGSE